jgi:hypothetical protein
MEELRPEIRTAFEKEQAAFPPVAALRRNVVEAVTTHPRPSHNLQWVAVAAAAILAILVVAGLMSTRLGHRAGAPVPAATPKASPVGDYGPPPAGVNLLYVHDPNHPSWLIGYDWSGQPRGTVKLDPTLVGGSFPNTSPSVGMAPDGQSFLVGNGPKGGTGPILDRLGQPVGALDAIPGKAGPIWADDNKHMCGVSLDLQTLDWTFVTLLPGEAVKSGPVIAREPIAGGQTGLRVASCSFRNDKAIVVRTTVSWPAEFWVLRISDGKILLRNTYSGGAVRANVVASGDGVLIAENSSQSTGQGGSAAPSTFIRRLSDMSVVATLDPSMSVLAFNGDDSLALVTTAPWLGGSLIHLAVIDFRSGRVVCRYDGPEELRSFLAEPDGTGFAITLRVLSTHVPEDPMSDVLIFHGDGSTTTISGRYVPTW